MAWCDIKTHCSSVEKPPLFQADMEALKGLERWQNAMKKEAGFAVEKFSCFLPKRENINLGETWMVVSSDMSRFGQFTLYIFYQQTVQVS
jgi:hypothetical protein